MTLSGRTRAFFVVSVATVSGGCSAHEHAGENQVPEGGPSSGGAVMSASGGTGGTVLGAPSGGGTTSSGGAAGTKSNGGSGGYTGTQLHDAGDTRQGDASGNPGRDGGAHETPAEAAIVRMLHRVTSDDDAYVTQANGTDAAAKAWLLAHWRMFEGFSGGPTPTAARWLPGGLLYFDTTAVNTGSNPPAEHVLKRAGTGQQCFNPWGGNPNPQVTWDVTSEATRQYLVGQMKQALAQAPWAGLWLDDVNLDPGSSCVGPNDETWYTEFGTGWADTWAGAVTTFVEEIRAAFPSKTLLENAPWFSRGPNRWTDPYVMRQLKTTSLANREGGVLDTGLTSGTGYWSVKDLYDYVDAVHAAGAGVVWDSFPANLAEQKYALAAYFIGYTDKDFFGDASARKPQSWPSVYDVDLGRPTAARTFDGNGRFSRAFEKGTVVLDVTAKTGVLPGF